MIRVPPLVVEAFAAAVSVVGSPVNLVRDMPNQAMTFERTVPKALDSESRRTRL